MATLDQIKPESPVIIAPDQNDKAEMGVDGEGFSKEDHQPSSDKANTAGHTLY